MRSSYKLTRGLLMSMALYYNTWEYTDIDKQIDCLDKMYEYYLNFNLGYIPPEENLIENGLFNEVFRMGKYSPSREIEYAYHWPVGFCPDWFSPYSARELSEIHGFEELPEDQRRKNLLCAQIKYCKKS